MSKKRYLFKQISFFQISGSLDSSSPAPCLAPCFRSRPAPSSASLFSSVCSPPLRLQPCLFLSILIHFPSSRSESSECSSFCIPLLCSLLASVSSLLTGHPCWTATAARMRLCCVAAATRTQLFSMALSGYSFMRLIAASAFAVPFNSASTRLRQFSVCICLVVLRCNDVHPGHLAVKPNSSKFSRDIHTRFGTRTCSSMFTLSLCTMSIITTSLLRRSPSILWSSSLLRHGTATTISKLLRSYLSVAGFLRTVLLSHTPFRFPTMNSAVVAFTPVLPHASQLPERSSCSFPPQDPFGERQALYFLPTCSQPSYEGFSTSTNLEPRQQKSRVLCNPRPNGMRRIDLHLPTVLRCRCESS